MNTQGCFTIIVNKEYKLLLVKRKDYPIWDFPGGRLENEESLEECAIRETQEETGYKISIVKKVGEYHRPQYQDTQHLFIAKIVGGKAIENGTETSKLAWFYPKKVPLFLIPNRKLQIKDYLNNKTNITRYLKEPYMLRLLRKWI
ncbi:NUDIX hydrolase [Bacillus sp. 03113]|uniref:NUDIX hydrolase n=1 Tax=Bacillaceae TaxID=186817 RepID=UPI00114329D1|nr:NUDIX hydrolase [Bacillus sp. 03113]